MTMHMVTIGTIWNCGMPKWNGTTTSTQERRRTLSKCMMPSAHASDRAGDDAEQHRDIGEEARAPFDQRQDDQQHEQRDAETAELAIARIDRSTCWPLMVRGKAGRPPPAQLMPTRISEMPITRMMVPVTTGGNSGSSRLTNGATSNGEHAGRDHRAVDAEQPDPGRRRHRQHRPTEAKVTPIITGRRMPTTGKAEALHQRGDAAGEQVGADQEGDVFRRQLERAADDQRHGDGAGIHHQHVLKSRAAPVAEKERVRRRDEPSEWQSDS